MKTVTNKVGQLGPDTMFGEVSLLKKVPRTATIVTVTPCELIVIYREDFDETLSLTLKKLWDEIKASLALFPYFSGLSENAQTECCMLSKIKTYKPNDIIYDSKIPFGFGYFVLKGTCRIIELITFEEKVVKYFI